MANTHAVAFQVLAQVSVEPHPGVIFAQGSRFGGHTLYIDEAAVDSKEIRTIVAFYSLGGERLCIGYDSSDPVRPDYPGRFDYTGGRIDIVLLDIADDTYIDLERQLAAVIDDRCNAISPDLAPHVRADVVVKFDLHDAVAAP